MTDTPILPIIHLNGTSHKELLELRYQALKALDAAINAMAAMTPNGRDYYPVDGLYQKAMSQHTARVDALTGIYESLTAEYLELDKLGRR